MSWEPDKWRKEVITGKQSDFIEAISEKLDKPFKGGDRGTASDYIEKYAHAFYESKQRGREGRAPTDSINIIKFEKPKKRDVEKMTLETALELAALNGLMKLSIIVDIFFTRNSFYATA